MQISPAVNPALIKLLQLQSQKYNKFSYQEVLSPQKKSNFSLSNLGR